MTVMTRRGFLSTAGGIVLATQLPPLELLAQDAARPPLLQPSLHQPLVQDAKVETVLNSGTRETRFDLVLLPEGYTAKMRKEWDKDVDSLVKGLDNYKVWQEYKNLLNIHKLWVPSDVEWSKASNGDGTAFGAVWDTSISSPKLKDTKKRDECRNEAKADLACVIIRYTSEFLPGYSAREGVLATAKPEVFFHELGHGFGLEDEYAKSSIGGINASADDKNPPWKELIGKVKGIATKKVVDGWYKGEERDCIMAVNRERIDYGLLCVNGIICDLRKLVRPIETATKEEPIEITKGKPLGIELTTNNSKSYKPVVQAWYATGTEEELEKLQSGLPKILTPQAFKDEKKWKKATVAAKGKGMAVNAPLPVGSHLVVVAAYDPNPAILIDPDGDTKDKRFYRVNVKE